MMVKHTEKSTFGKVWNNMKDHKSQYLAASVMVGATIAVLWMRGFHTQQPMAEEVRRGDGYCHQSEAYPYMLNSDATIKTTTGEHVQRPQDCQRGQENICIRNPNYSKEDCHDGDGVCDSATDASQLRDPSGNPVVNFLSRDFYGRNITFPLEGPDSFDCRMDPARTSPCGAFDPSHPVLDRQRIVQPITGLRQRSLDELQALISSNQPPVQVQQTSVNAIPSSSARPASSALVTLPHVPTFQLVTSGNYFTVLSAYRETCDQSLPICNPTSLDACFCPNVRECAEPPVPTNQCGNGRIDRGEQCDFNNRSSPRGGCQEGKVCSRSCRCITIDPGHPPVCGNGRIEEGEECDRTGCAAGETCTNCQCVSDQAPPPPTTDQCPNEVLRNLNQTAYSQAMRHIDTIRDTVGGGGNASINITVNVRVSSGVATPTGATGSCNVLNCRSAPIDVSIFNFVSIRMNYQGNCIGSFPFTIQPG